MLCAIWHRLYNFKNVTNTHERVLLLVKFQSEACNFTKSNTPAWVFFTFFKLCKWYGIAKNVSNTDELNYVPNIFTFFQTRLVVFQKNLKT